MVGVFFRENLCSIVSLQLYTVEQGFSIMIEKTKFEENAMKRIIQVLRYEPQVKKQAGTGPSWRHI